jgi:biotin carboxylase
MFEGSVRQLLQSDMVTCRVMKDLKGARVVAGALVEGDAEDDGNAAEWMDLSIMMEEYLDGDEVDVDLVFSSHQPVYGAITDNWPTVEPYFNETGSNCPSLLSRAKQMELMDLAVKAVQCMNFELGVFHVELKYTSRGARLIEVNARMGGGPVRDTNLLVWGVDLVEQQVLSCCGIKCRPAIARKPLNELAELTVNATVRTNLSQANLCLTTVP